MCADINSAFQDGISFGPFRLFPGKRLVERDGVPLRIGSRSLDILIVLVERAGEVVSKAELISRVWPNMVVDESGLRVHLAALRRSIGDGLDGARYIANVTGRGYSFVAPVERQSALRIVASEETVSNPLDRLPAPLKRMVGREETVRRLTSQILSDRFLTIVGPGGIGKTTVAVSIAHALLPEFNGDVFFVDLGTVIDSDFIVRSIASTLGYKGHGGDQALTLAAFLAHKRAVIVLDNCEHVIDAVTALTERILIEAPRVHILATSREALRAKDERVHQLTPLDSPAELHGLTAAAAREFPAVQLFVERAAASDSSFTITDADAPIIAGICGRLDGIALAIELAASRVATHGIRGIAGLLDDRFRLSWKGHRTALPRHRTLNAMLDWSHNLLQEKERLLLRRLSIFVGSFARDAVEAVACDHDLTPVQAMDALESLSAKSLLSTSTGEAETRYRLLETTRAYAADKLSLSREGGLIARRHAAYFAQEAKRAEQLGDLRAALAWCFSSQGDPAIGADLAAAAAPIFLELSLPDECHRWCKRALLVPDEETRGGPRQIDLSEALGISTISTRAIGENVPGGVRWPRGARLARPLAEPIRLRRRPAALVGRRYTKRKTDA